jgi:hypothetical protein
MKKQGALKIHLIVTFLQNANVKGPNEAKNKFQCQHEENNNIPGNVF